MAGLRRAGFAAALSLAASLGTWGLAAAQEAEPVSLDYFAAQQRFLDRSDAIEAAGANVRSREAQEQSVRHLRRPDVDLEVQLLEYQKTLYLPLGSLAPVAVQFGIADPLRFKQEMTVTRPIATATLPLYTGGQIDATRAGARAQLNAAKAERDLATDTGLSQLVQAYYGQQLAERALGVRRDVLAGLERHVSDVARLEQEGFASRAQLLQAEVARDEAAREYQNAIAALATANASLAGLLRSPSGVRPVSPLFIISKPLEPLEEFTAVSLRQHPQLRRLGAVRDEAAAGIRIEEAKRKPQVYGFAQYNFAPRDALLTDPDWTLGVGFRYKFLSGVDRGASIDAARQTAAQALAGARETETQIGIGVTKAWFEVDAARRSFLLLESAIVSAQENLRLQSIAYREQQATSLDVVDAQLGIGRARIQQAQAAYDYVTALADLLSVSGQMDRMADYVNRADRIVP